MQYPETNLLLFHSHVPAAQPSPTPLPPAAIDLLIHRCPDWMSSSWSKLFKTVYSGSSREYPQGLPGRWHSLQQILSGGRLDTLPGIRGSVAILHCPPPSGQTGSWYDQIIPGCHMLRANSTWHGKPSDPFHAPGRICVERGEIGYPC